MSSFNEELVYVIGHNESGNSYTSVNMSDVVSIGLFNWYGARALGLAREIVADDPTGSQTTLAGASSNLYAQITSGNNNVWNSYVPSQHTGDVAALQLFLDLPASHTVQDELALQDGQGYVSQAIARGIVEPKAQIYFADLYNQSPLQAGNIASAVKGAGLAFTLETLHEYAMRNTVMKKYSTRRNWTYTTLAAWTQENTPVVPPVNPPNNNGGGNLPPSAYDIKDYILMYNGGLIHYSVDYPEGIYYVAGQNVFLPASTEFLKNVTGGNEGNENGGNENG